MSPIVVSTVGSRVCGKSEDARIQAAGARLNGIDYSPVVEKLVGVENVDVDVAEATLIEGLRFMLVKAWKGEICNEVTRYCTSARLNNAWHVIMEFTEIYRDSCHAMTAPEARIIQCEPQFTTESNWAELYQRTRKAYTQLYQEDPPMAWWPDVAKPTGIPEPPSAPSMTVIVKGPKGPAFPIKAAPAWRILHLMGDIQEKTGVTPENQELILNGRKLGQQCILQTEGVLDGTKLNMVIHHVHA